MSAMTLIYLFGAAYLLFEGVSVWAGWTPPERFLTGLLCLAVAVNLLHAALAPEASS